MRFLNQLFSKHKSKAPGEVENPDLLAAMHECAINDCPNTRLKLYKALLKSTFLVPTPEMPSNLQPGFQTTNEVVKIQVTFVIDASQQKLIPVFTDSAALRNWDPNTPSLGLKAKELFRLTSTTDAAQIVVNPFDPIRMMIKPGGRINRREFICLADGKIPFPDGEITLNPRETIAIGLPAKPPSEAVVSSIRDYMQSSWEIDEGYLFQMSTESTGAFPCIGLVFMSSLKQERVREMIREMGRLARLSLAANEALDFFVLNGRGQMLSDVRKTGRLIYKR